MDAGPADHPAVDEPALPLRLFLGGFAKGRGLKVRMIRELVSLQDFHFVVGEIRFGQVLQFHADGQSALKFRDQVGRLGDVERARRDEEDMVGANGTVFGGDRRPFDDG